MQVPLLLACRRNGQPLDNFRKAGPPIENYLQSYWPVGVTFKFQAPQPISLKTLGRELLDNNNIQTFTLPAAPNYPLKMPQAKSIIETIRLFIEVHWGPISPTLP